MPEFGFLLLAGIGAGLVGSIAGYVMIAVCVLLFAGYPVALTLGGVSLGFALIGHALGAMDLGLLGDKTIPLAQRLRPA